MPGLMLLMHILLRQKSLISVDVECMSECNYFLVKITMVTNLNMSTKLRILFMHYDLLLQVVGVKGEPVCSGFRVGTCRRERITESRSTATFRHAFSEMSASKETSDYKN